RRRPWWWTADIRCKSAAVPKMPRATFFSRPMPRTRRRRQDADGRVLPGLVVSRCANARQWATDRGCPDGERLMPISIAEVKSSRLSDDKKEVVIAGKGKYVGELELFVARECLDDFIQALLRAKTALGL